MKYTIIDSATHTIINAKSKKDLFKEIKDSTPFFRNQTDKQFMEGYSIRRQLLGLSSLNTTSVEKFIDSMIANQLIVKGVMSQKTAISKFSANTKKQSGIGGRKTIDKKVEAIQKKREFEAKLDRMDAEQDAKLTPEQRKKYRLLEMQRREARRNAGTLPKTFSEQKKIGSTDSVISLSKIKEFAESIKQVERDKFKRSRKIQKFIEANTPLVNAEDLTKGSTIWVFSGAPQYYIGRAKLEYKSSSKSPNFVTLYLTDDNKYEEWRKADSYENSMKDFDQISIPAIRFGEGKYYKSVKKDKKIPLG